MRLFPVVCFFLTSCTVPEQTPATGATPTSSVQLCREGASPLEAASGSASEMVLLAVVRTQANDLRCGPPPPEVRVCRALFVLSVIDPVNSLNEPEELARAQDAVSWVLRDAASVAEDAALTAALLWLDDLNHDLITAADDDARAEMVQQRANRAILDPIEAAWTRCA